MPADLTRTCPVCGQNAPEEYLHKAELRLVRCRSCAMVYASPVPGEYVSGDYYKRAGTDYYLSAAKLLSDYAPVRFARELRLFRRYCRGGAVLDVGCSSGAFLFQLNRRFPGEYRVLGTDASGPALDYAQSQGVPVVRGDFLQADFGGQRFQAVTFWAVLEHLSEPRAFLAKAASLLEPGGLCFVLVPNMKSLAARFLGARYRYIYPQHLNYFTRTALHRLVADDFATIAWRFTHFNPIILWQDWRQGSREVSNEERGDLLQRTTAYKQNRLLAPVRFLYAAAEKTLGWLGLADNLALVLKKRG